ncbi:UNVERIFIED_CONTAM: hypothetical protein FKN15_060846 [Acipenser sinensis]
MDRGFVERLESRSISEGNRTSGAESIMATGLSGVGSAFEGQSLKLVTNEFPHTSAATTDDDDDVVFVELSPSAQNSTPTPLPTSTALPTPPAPQAPLEVFPRAETTKILSHPKEPVALSVDSLAEPIVIDDEEDADFEQSLAHVSSKGAFPEPNGTSKMDIVGSSSNKLGSPLTHTVISTEPDSEIKIANVTTLDMASMLTNSVQGPLAPAVTTEGPLDMNLMITSVTSLQNASLREVGNGPQISSTFSLNPEVQSASATTHTDVNRPGVHSGAGTFNPGRIGTTGEGVQNGESGTYQRPAFSHKPAPKKNCTMCKKDITSMKGTIVAQVDSSESFQEFCSPTCLSSYENKQNPAKPPIKTRCIVCGKLTEIRHEVSFKNVTHKICSDHCFNRYRMTNGLIMNCCEQCGEHLQTKSTANHFLIIDGQQKRFCCQNCVKDYKQAHGKITCCTGCRTPCRFFDITHCIGPNGNMEPYCSTACMNSHKSKNSRPAGTAPTCHFCKRSALPQSQATMPDGKLYNFCSSDCVSKFQAARCDCCKVQGNLTESVQWRAEMKRFCDQQCLLRFYCQQNVPNMSTQRGPENMCFGQGNQTGSKATISHHTSSVSSHSTSPLKDMKNKSILCKPLTMTKATYCKPHMQTKSCQTEEEVKTKYVPVPIPVPVYIPVPVHLYSQNTPVPLTLPVPVPVPVFLPTTLDSAEKIVQTIDELRAKIPSDPLEADILAMAEMIAEADETEDCADATSEVDGIGEKVKSTSTDTLYEPELDLETDFPKVAEELKTEIAFMLPQVLGEENEEKEEKPRPQVKKKGSKRGAVLCSNSKVGKPDTPESGFAMKSTYGINAWKRWILTRNEADEDKKQKDEVKHTKPVRLKMDLLSHTAAELNYGLCRFVHEVRRPNEECYSPDSIYYLCLGIQQHLYVNDRADNIFSDPYYQMFGQELNKIFKDWHPSVLPNGSIFSRIEEEYLWSCKQFGEHSPMVLLSTLVYFNTKYFGLRTVDQHLRLSFGNVFRQWRKNPHAKESTVCIRVHSVSEDLDKTATRKRKHKDDEDPDYEPEGNSGSLSWCPAKKRESYLYELYLSKCPESLKSRMDLFYMKPESSSSPDSPLWYTTTSLDRNTLESLLNRILLIRDIYDERDTSLDEED